MAVIGEDEWGDEEPGREPIIRPDRRDGNLKARTALMVFIRRQHCDCLLVREALLIRKWEAD